MASTTAPDRLFRSPLVVVVLTLALVIVTSALLQAAGAQLLNRSLQLSDARPGHASSYVFGFRPPTLDTIETMVIQICSNDPYPGTPCDAPTGFDASGAILSKQSGDQGFTINPASTANQLVLQRSPISSNGQADSYQFDNIINPSNAGSYFVRVQTFTDSDTTGTANYYGGIAFAINRNIDVTAVVPPYLLFCAGVSIGGMDCSNVQGDYVNFGQFSSRQASQGSTQLLAASNALDGYNIRVTGTTLTSGTHVIPELVGADVSRPGVSQFGLNLRANSSPPGGQDVVGSGTGYPANGYGQINFYRFNSGDVVAASTAPDEARKYTASYIVNVSSGQAPGVYVSTLTYIALGSF